MNPTPLVLTAAFGSYGNTQAIKDDPRVSERLRLDFVEVRPNVAIFRRMVRGLEFDVAEMAITTYILARAFDKGFTALPIFITRDFHHSTIVYNTSSGIRAPKDLEGRRVGVRAYTVTTGVWTRGILQTEEGVNLDAVTWVTDDEEHVQEYRPPSNVVAAPEGKSLAEMIVSGEIDAALSGAAGIGRRGPPTAAWGAPPPQLTIHGPADAELIEPLIPDAKAREAEWFRRTGIYPIHGVIVVKNTLLAAHPWIAEDLFVAFKATKQRFIDRLAASGPTSPAEEKLAAFQAIVGPDPLPYGLEPNRPTLEALLQFGYDQKVIPAKYAVEGIFAPGSAELN